VKSGFESVCMASSQPMEDCLRERNLVVMRMARSCSASAPCRDDFVCARQAGAPPGVGVCVPPYFLFQSRVDGPRIDR
jgi:hypothetical protein